MKKLPKEILVYQCDEINGEPVYTVAREINDIPEEIDGEKVGIYILNRGYTFRIQRKLK